MGTPLDEPADENFEETALPPGDLGLPPAIFKESPEDFVVEEIPAYAPSGAGEHLYLTFRKRGWATPDAVNALARALGLDPRGAGWAGMKDKHAVTTQTASFQAPLALDAGALVSAVAIPGIEVLTAARHGNKLKPGHLIGNRFRIELRGLTPGAQSQMTAGLLALGRDGAPNYFGEQRFGRGGDNAARAIEFVSGRARPPRDRRTARLLFSALQSDLFNRVLRARVEGGTWRTVLAGDLARKTDTGGMFEVPADEPGLSDAVARAARGEIGATGPLFGDSMRWPSGAPRALEEEVLAQAELPPDAFERHRALGSGTRRDLLLPVTELEVEATAGGLRVAFVLPKGAYATTVLGLVCHLTGPARTATPALSPGPGHGKEPEAPGEARKEDTRDEGAHPEGALHELRKANVPE